MVVYALQVVYYVYAYAQLVKQGALQIGEAMNVVVPTGNFGNILAAYYAKQLGVPIQTLVCASKWKWCISRLLPHRNIQPSKKIWSKQVLQVWIF